MAVGLISHPKLGDAEFDGFRRLVRRAAGIHLSDAKRDLVASRLARRLRRLGLDSYRAYYDLVRRSDPDGSELREMVNCITTNKTSFFREPHHFETLAAFLQRKTQVDTSLIRIWSAGCSTGEEPYTIALTAIEALGVHRAVSRVQVDATDIDTNVLKTAENGVYPESSVGEMSEARRRLGFLRGVGSQVGRVSARSEMRRLIRFSQFNLNAPEPWNDQGDFDVIFCRNVVIYFDAPTRSTLLERFAEHLKPDGLLFLGHSEGLHANKGLFEAAGRTTFRHAGVGAMESVPVSSREHPRASRPQPSPKRDARRARDTERRVPAPRSPSRRLPLADRTVTVGGVAVERGPLWIRTLLGSCVAACLFDTKAGVGGMNHFLLPEGQHSHAPASRYGVHAMELLINEIMKNGGDRRRLRAKLFGGAAVLGFQSEIGVPRANVEFARTFLEVEGIPLVAEQLGGRDPLDVRMEASTGRVLVRAIGVERAREDLEAEARYNREFWTKEATPPSDSVTLF